jgi:hypothetical protein
MARTLSTRSRFLIAYLLLGAAVGAALGAFIVLVQRPAPPPAPQWSSWRPDGSGSVSSQQREIADHVGSGYRLGDGNPLVNAQIDNRNLRSIVVPKVAQPQGPSDFATYDRSSTAIYLLCGYGAHCRVTPGKQTKARGTVLRREALELALYTLKYLHPIDNVLVFFPPLAGEKSVSATLFFHRGDLKGSLGHPLRKTLPQVVPPAPGQIRPAEQRTVDDLTKATYYHYLRTEDVQGYGNVVELLPPS